MGYLLGPAPQKPIYVNSLPNLPKNYDSLVDFITKKEHQHHVKAGNNAEIIWFDSLHKKTEYVIVYLQQHIILFAQFWRSNIIKV